jgi:hypothetical protein
MPVDCPYDFLMSFVDATYRPKQMSFASTFSDTEQAIHHRPMLFSFWCVGIRMLVVLLAASLGNSVLQAMGGLFLVLGLAFAVRYVRFDPTKGNIGQFGGPIWWNNMRLLHALTYLLFGVMAIRGSKTAWIVLLVDVLLSIAVVYRRST